jgi:uncharacterized repeat protein (TIGR03803 family)
MTSRLVKTVMLSAAAAVSLAIPLSGAQAGKFKVLYAFLDNGSDGLDPQGGLVRDKAGNLFGVTAYGGTSDKGTIFQILPDGSENKLYNFTSTPDGGLPRGRLLPDAAGNFYATATIGGANGYGAVVRLAPDGTESVLYSFQGSSDGYQPIGDLVSDRQGNLYGVTVAGGDFTCLQTGCGVIFKLAPDGSESVLHAFSAGEGFYALASVISDTSGNLYGTTSGGGANGFGTAYRLAPDGTLTVLHSFAGGSDGANPAAGLLLDPAGNLYGTTEYGGGSTNCDGGCGVIFKLAADGAETVLHAFAGNTDGSAPAASLIQGRDGNIYGTASAGGRRNFGTVFRMTPDGGFNLLHAFRGKDGETPVSELLMDKKGNLFGSAYYGGAGHKGSNGSGVVFEIKGATRSK